jgi:methyl-accepting chemotaxis protein
MFSIANLKIGARLGLAFGVLLLLLVTLIAAGMVNMSRIQGHLDEIVNDNMYKTKLVNTMSESVHIVARVLRTIVILEDRPVEDGQFSKIVAARKAYGEAWEALEKTPASERGKAIRAKIYELAEVARTLNTRAIELGLANKTAEATAVLIKEAGPATQKWQEALDENLALQEENTKKDVESAQSAYAAARTLMICLGVAALLIGVFATILITRSITRPLNVAMGVAKRIAEGDLTEEVNVAGKDETAVLLGSLKTMQGNLTSTIVEIKSAADTINTASGEIASGNTDLSQRTEEQASSIEETASSMEELTSTVKQNAENAKQANQLAVGASDVAVRGGDVVKQVVQTMSSISESSKKIVDIISVIDGIAFQTNILALNAAVEAARAGEQGRGFAVVAGEVRNLAQRSAAAAKEIKELISNSVAKVDTGTELVAQAGKTMDEIVTSVKRVTDIMSEITAASQEQSTGIEQVNQAVSQMDEVTQQNAALVEQAAAAAESLNEEAQNLTRSVAVFKLGHGQQARSSVTRAAVPVGEGSLERAAGATNGIERRAAERPKNVARLPKAKAQTAVAKTSASAASKKTGTDDEWQEF